MRKRNKLAQSDLAANAAQAQRWNGASGQYWIAHRKRHLAEHQHLTPHLFRAAGISPGDRVIDVGCGCGDTTIAAARSAAGGTERSPGCDEPGWAVGLDLSAPMLEVAGQHAARAGLANVAFVRADAQAGPLRKDSFDVVISKFGVMFFADPRTAFAGLAASLRPGGRLAFLCWQDDNLNEVFAIPLRAVADYTCLPEPTANELFTDPGQITELLSGAGWAEIEIAQISEPARMGSDVDDVMGYIRGMSVIRDAAETLGDEKEFERMLARIADDYAARQRQDGVWVNAAAWLVTGRRA
jgi:ubiquinone/menaquinone biosynthesis C-methylase UbiE